ncbi:MAG: hypothetical protein IJY16_09235 [Clostridia bacterium]|nr:hypothetical protein [Clostridia bacterium]
MVHYSVDFNHIKGKIKPMHAIGQPPFSSGFLSFDFSYMDYLRRAHIPYSRLHDVGGPFGGNRFVDIPNLFRDFNADENDPESYDFAFTDVLLEALAAYGVEPIFRLGVTIENQAHVKAYRINPPKDPAKWARICEHVVRHYNEGWANGYHYNITYWEIWNEPENGLPGKNQCWTGTKEQLYELYDVTAKHLKSCFGDKIKVGGYGASGMYGIYYHPERFGLTGVPAREPDDRYEQDLYRIEFFNGFLEYIAEHRSPIDFFSWHSYANLKKTLHIAEYIDRRLNDYGLTDIETHCNEWNNAQERALIGTSYAAAMTAATFMGFHATRTNIMCYYDMKLAGSNYAGCFDHLDLHPLATYYAFAAFGELYALGGHAAHTVSGDSNGLYALAATDGERKAMLISNVSEEKKEITTDLGEGFKVYLIDSEHMLDATELSADTFTAEPNQVLLICNYEAEAASISTSQREVLYVSDNGVKARPN